MPIIDGPPPPNHFVIRSGASICLSALGPGLVLANEMCHAYSGLKMSICGQVLVVCRWGDVVGEAQAIEIVLEMHIQKTLVCSIKRYASLCHCEQCKVVTHVRVQDH